VLDAQQQQYIVGVIHHWLVLQMNPKIDELLSGSICAIDGC
jgi:hypothetical protein